MNIHTSLRISILAMLLFYLKLTALGQADNVGIGTSSPHPSAVLEIQATDKGILIPRGDTLSVLSPAVGLLIYQISADRFFYFDGLKWQPIPSDGNLSSGNAWNLDGNSATNPAANFVGTTDAEDLVNRTNNAPVARFFSNGQVAIGTSSNPPGDSRFYVVGGSGGSPGFYPVGIRTDRLAVEGNGILNVGGNFGIQGAGNSVRQYVDNAVANTTLNFNNLAPSFSLNVNFEESIGLGTSSTHDGSVIFRNAANNNSLTIRSGATSASHSLTLPTDQGSANSVLTNDGSGNLSWEIASGGGGFTNMEVFTSRAIALKFPNSWEFP